ncbi:MAG: His/Gly/Thr/Pro-type tRNA ligase C-terminal domain-containing protein, partial [Syntrophales bacterium]|nr:His/Gly/Thr/Pro-type tRNA ligase C-terminal domain-containing protein [Syntrophales bacterium]
MGCYGIGVTRTVAAAIEQYHDEDGIIWPVPIAPFQVIITPVNINEGTLCKAAEDLYQELTAQGLEVLLDDRDERAGVKFKDADLIGIPYRVTIGPKKLAEGKVEVKNRRSGEVLSVDLSGTADYLTTVVKTELDRLG